MQRVSLRRHVEADPVAVQAALADTEAFMRAGGYDTVAVDGDDIELANRVGLLTIELDLTVVDDPAADFAYEQVDGIFETMRTAIALEDAPEGGTLVTGETEFELDTAVVGPILDATIIKRQRRAELTGHFDYLERAASR